MPALIRKLKNMSYIHIITFILVGLAFAGSLYFVEHNQSLYDRSIAEVENVKIINSNDMEDMNGNNDRLYTQQIKAEIKNGEHEGKKILLKNEYSSSGAYDQPYKPGNEVFVTIDKDGNDSGALTGAIEDVKRDKYLMMITWVFILLILAVGKKQGMFSLVTLAINAVVLSYALDVYIETDGTNLLLICSVGVILFTAISLLFVNGFNEKTYAAVVSTLLTTFITLFISYAVVKLTGGNGLRYEEMQFLTRPYEAVFLAGILIGCLGAVMDVAITLSSSIFGLYEKNQGISIKALTKSGFEIGRDIMGTMTNILFFVYISGAIPMLILYFKNASPLGFTLTMNLSLETARALSGGIGIVLTIPIAIFISIFFVKRKKAKL